MLIPKKLKYRKVHRGRGTLRGVAQTGFELAFGSYGLKAIGRGEITSRQIESARRAINRYVKRTGKLWIRIFPHKPVTQKAAEVPMGSGKGSVEFYVFPTLPGKVIFEMEGVTESIAREAFRLASYKLPLKTKFVKKEF
ncbi:50S ribosomal protein L16 [Candidatus Peregrinibacteria bacterium]|nr:MAG: 50S ribosomal protein L16 [Candidatus Peregrinibacteria bacterium]